MKQLLVNYQSILLLLLGIIVGSFFGLWFPQYVDYIKPLGDIFLNLLFVAVIPLLFFAITDAVSHIEAGESLGRIIRTMLVVFVTTIVFASILTIVALYIFPVSTTASNSLENTLALTETDTWANHFVQFVSVGEFHELLSRANILAFVIFSFLLSIAIRNTGEKANSFKHFIQSGNEVMQQLLQLIMKAGPIGLGAYFGYQVKEIGPELFGTYAKPLAFYYIFGTIFFILIYSLYAFVGQGTLGITSYWKNNIAPTLTAISTCSSLATLPTNLLAARKMSIPNDVANVVIPLGNTLYKNGSVLSSILKIYVAFAILGWNFFETQNIMIAIGITLLVSMVAGGIPNGGFIGELLMISVYGIPNEAVPAILIIGTLVDPLATVLNATGDTVAAMMVTRFSRAR